MRRDKLVGFIKDNYLILAIIILFITLHIPGITTPPIDEHNWRQVDTAAVARNFQYESPNIFLPRVDIRGELSGITGMEFPIYNYILFLLNFLLGYQDWHGRIITLVFSSIGIFIFFEFIKARYSKRLGIISSFVLAFTPLYFVFSKNIQPDVLMLTLLITSLYFAQRYSEKYSNKFFYLMIASLSLATLIKMPAIFIVFPILLIIKKQGLRKFLELRKILFLIIVFVLPVLLWYLWSDHLSKFYGMGNYFYGDLSIIKSISLSSKKYFWKVISEYIIPSNFILGGAYLLFLIGILFSLAKKNYLIIVWFLSFIMFIGIFSIKSYYHNYYSLPLVPPVALAIGVSIDWIFTKLKEESKLASKLFLFIIFFLIFLYSFTRADEIYSPKVSPRYSELNRITKEIIPKDNLVITNANVNPVILYFSKQKGWSLPSSMMNKADISEYNKIGASYVLIDKQFSSSEQLKELDLFLDKKYQDNNFVVYKISF